MPEMAPALEPGVWGSLGFEAPLKGVLGMYTYMPQNRICTGMRGHTGSGV